MNLGIFDISCDDILQFPFPYKIWIIVHLELCEFIHWTRDGTGFLLELNGLDNYLASSVSIFKIKNRSDFIQHLHEFGFKRECDLTDLSQNFWIIYKQEFFRRHRLDLVSSIHSLNPSRLNICTDDDRNDEQYVEDINHIEARLILLRLRGDPCFSFQGTVSRLQRLRLLLQTTSHFQNVTKKLEQKLEQSHLLSDETKRLLKMDLNGRQRSNGNSQIAQNTETINSILGVNNYVNPYNSISQWANPVNGEDKSELLEHSPPEYAGYYGSCNSLQLANFFGKYLPTFEDNSNEIKKIPHPEPKIANNTVDDNNLKKNDENGLGKDSLDTKLKSCLKSSTESKKTDEKGSSEKRQFAKDSTNNTENNKLLENGKDDQLGSLGKKSIRRKRKTDDDCGNKNSKPEKSVQKVKIALEQNSSSKNSTSEEKVTNTNMNHRNSDSSSNTNTNTNINTTSTKNTTKSSKNIVGKVKNKETTKHQNTKGKQTKQKQKETKNEPFAEPHKLLPYKSENLEESLDEDSELSDDNQFYATPAALNQIVNKEVKNLRKFCREYRSTLNVLYEHF